MSCFSNRGWLKTMTRNFAVIIMLVVGILGWVALPAAGQAACEVSPSSSTTADEVSAYISQCLSVSAQHKAALAAATTAAINSSRLNAEETLDMLQRLEASDASQSESESMMTTFTNTLNANIPADLLIEEIKQGIAFGFSGSTIVTNVTNVAATLEDVNSLIGNKGLKSEYAASLLDPVISAIAEALEDYIANSSNPAADSEDSAKVAEFVYGRLDQLAGSPLDAGVISEVKSNVQDGELANIAQNVCSRRGSC